MTDKERSIADVKEIIKRLQKKMVSRPFSIDEHTIEQIAKSLETAYGMNRYKMMELLEKSLPLAVAGKYIGKNIYYNCKAQADEMEHNRKKNEGVLEKLLFDDQIARYKELGQELSDKEYNEMKNKFIKTGGVEITAEDVIKSMMWLSNDWKERANVLKVAKTGKLSQSNNTDTIDSNESTKKMSNPEHDREEKRAKYTKIYKQCASRGVFKELDKYIGLDYTHEYDKSWGPTDKEMEVLEAFEKNNFTKFNDPELIIQLIYENTCMYVDRSGLDDDGELYSVIVSERKQDLNIEDFKRSILLGFNPLDVNEEKREAFIEELDKIKTKYSKKTKGVRI